MMEITEDQSVRIYMYILVYKKSGFQNCLYVHAIGPSVLRENLVSVVSKNMELRIPP